MGQIVECAHSVASLERQALAPSATSAKPAVAQFAIKFALPLVIHSLRCLFCKGDCAALGPALCLAAMQLRTYLEAFSLSLPLMLAKLADAAQPGELSEGFGISAISRHSRGLLFPTPILQELYSRATDGAVQPHDWVKLALEKRAQQGELAQ